MFRGWFGLWQQHTQTIEGSSDDDAALACRLVRRDRMQAVSPVVMRSHRDVYVILACAHAEFTYGSRVLRRAVRHRLST